MGRTSYCDGKTGFRKGTWTAEEDRKLIDFVTRYGCSNWRQLPKYAGLARCGKSCRLRWVNYLKPDIKRGNFSKEEDQIILNLHQHLGNKWSSIAAKLPGRTDNEIKNHWHTSLKKQYKHRPPPPPSRRRRKPNRGSPVGPSSSSSRPDGGVNSPQNEDRHSPASQDEITEISGQRPASSGEASSSSSLTEGDGTVAADGGSFWTEPFIVEGNGNGWSWPSTSRNDSDVAAVRSSSMELGLLFPPFPFLPDCGDDDFDHLLLFDSLW